MTRWTLIRRSLRFHARSHLGVVLGAAIGSAVLVGALVVGDSVRGSLREQALQRLGEVDWAMSTGDRLFSESLAVDWEASRKASPGLTEGGEMCGILRLPATAGTADGSARANHVQVLGVNAQFSDLGASTGLATLPDDAVALNESLAAQLNVRTGDVILLRVQKPSALSRESVISPRDATQSALRLRVHAIIGAEGLGDYSLLAGQSPPLNAFVSLSMLQEVVSATNQVNEMLVGTASGKSVMSVPVNRAYGWILFFAGELTGRRYVFDGGDGRFFRNRGGTANQTLNFSLAYRWQLRDAGLELRASADPETLELRSPRIFLDAAVVRAVEGPINWERFLASTDREVVKELMQLYATPQVREALDRQLRTNVQPLLTFLVNLITAETNTTPYSMVAGAGPPYTPTEMRDDEIIINQWLADDLGVKPGDEIKLVYFLPESGALLLEATNRFRVRGIVPMELPWADRTLMPDFPGVAEAESTHDWDGGFPLVHTIRPKDEDYWKQYRGTPKAFVTLAAGQAMWANRFGGVTAIRFPVGSLEFRLQAAGEGGRVVPDRLNPELQTAEEYRAALERKILSSLKPVELGLRFEPVREQALKSVKEAQDFGQLFLGFSFFLVVAALLLMALMFQFGLDQRATEVGTLLALGFTPKRVRRLFLWEGAALAVIGSVLGVAGGIGFARAMLYGLTTVWRDAVGESSLSFHTTPMSLVIGAVASSVVGAITLWIALRKQARQPAQELLAEGGEARGARLSSGWTKRCWSHWVGAAALVAALALIGWSISRGDTTNAGVFFGAGSLLLIAGLSFCSGMFASLARSATATRLTLAGMGVRGAARRRSRSLAVITLLACGSFLIVAIGAFRLDANRDATRRSSGTGGFALIGESTLPVVHDLNRREGREFFNLDDASMEGVSVVPFRVRGGDDASCLNLSRAQTPRLLGVKPEALEGRFTFVKMIDGVWSEEPWKSLKPGEFYPTHDKPLASDEIPAIGDAVSIQWALGKKVGDTLDYVDERGRAFKVRIVGAVANSMLQGSLIIDEAEFVKRFPGESGYRMFLIDAPSNAESEVSADLTRALRDYGLEVTPAPQRLAQFNAVQNTYLGTFQVLGGLGLLLGSAGLGVVALRNVLERRGELALLLAVGFRSRALRKLVLSEHGALLALGLFTGVIAAIVAVLPPLLSPGQQIPYGSLALTLLAVLLNGLLWTWLAARFALRGRLLDALRNE